MPPRNISNYIIVAEAAEKWGISSRRVCKLCQMGRVGGAIKMAGAWLIPANTKKPEDGRFLRKTKRPTKPATESREEATV